MEDRIRSALIWAAIYFSADKWTTWGSRDVILEFILEDLYVARLELRNDSSLD